MWSKEDYKKVFELIDSFERDMVDMQSRITAIPAISPDSGGQGEAKKAALLKKMLSSLKPDELTQVDAPDERAETGGRPSLIAKWSGENTDKTIWIMAHMDIVSPGPLEKWDSDPYKVVEKDGKIIGRGVEDNQQALVASFFAVKAMLEAGLKPEINVGLIFVADEENGSMYGIDYVLKEHDFFGKDDLILVPDTGSPDGADIEVAEKSILWVKTTVTGKQSHGSLPGAGNNAHRAGAKLIMAIDEALHAAYTETDRLFNPPESTFEPTKKETNVDSVNIIPGEDIFYFDCRMLPSVDVAEVEDIFREKARNIEEEFGVKVSMEMPQKVIAAAPTPVESEVVTKLSKAILETRGLEARPVGIGGGTVASFFRNAGYPVAVWGTLDETMHQPNEYCKIANMVADAKVFAHMFGQQA